MYYTIKRSRLTTLSGRRIEHYQLYPTDLATAFRLLPKAAVLTRWLTNGHRLTATVLPF
ncbi:MAG: hypothetical protein HEP71_14515 [Roseivirga sp.]|nr:hypothetical protein [Roseivirga sp.]